MKPISLTARKNSYDHQYVTVQDFLQQADIRVDGSRPWDIKICHPDFFKCIMQQGLLGLGESYMDGWWECERVDILIYKFLTGRLDEYLPIHLHNILNLFSAKLLSLKPDHVSLTSGNKEHEIGYDIFAVMLDNYMQYSCGLWREGTSLDEAQTAKLQMICEKLQLSPGMRILDLGCGWGGTAEYMARHYGVYVEGITDSTEQQKVAQARCRDLDVTIMLGDFHDCIDDQFDRIISLGTLQNIELRNYQAFFKRIANSLNPDGRCLLQSIGKDQFVNHVGLWINKYIFPRGCLPSEEQIVRSTQPYLHIEDWINLGGDYDKTFMSWEKRINDAWPELKDNYSPRFKRMLDYYLCSCAGFLRAKKLNMWQMVFSRNIDAEMS